MPDETVTFESQVNKVVAEVTKDDKGKLVFPEGLDESLTFAARSEIRRRDTQAAYSQGQQKLKALEAENNSLAKSWEQDAVSKLSSSDQAVLEELKVQDPDAWRAKITELEETNRTKFQEKRTAITQEASQLTEIDRRTAQLEQFNVDNPTIQLTDDVITNDIPPRITKKLENGEIQFDEFLSEVAVYLGKGKVIATGDKPPEEPDFSNARGSNKPSEEAFKKQGANDYKKEIF